MHNKKVQFLFDHFYPSTGGVQYNTLQTYSRLVKHGWIAEALVNNFEKSPGILCKPLETIEGITVRRYPYFKYNFLPFLLDLDFNNTLICLHDFIILPHYYIYLVTLIKKITGTKTHGLILHSHGLFNSPLKPYSGFELIKRTLKKIIDRTIGIYLVNRTVDMIRAVSTNEMEALVKSGINPSIIEVINNGVNFNEIPLDDSLYSEKIKSLVKKSGSYIFQIGRIDRFKNFEKAIEALKLLDPSIHLLIIGPEQDTNYKLELVELIKKLNLTDRVCFTGEITGPDRYFVMKNAFACVHMAINEGYGNVINEAMSQGCVCFASNTLTKEIMEDNFNGFRIPINDPEQLASKLNYYYKHQSDDVYLNIKKNAIDSVKDRGWDSVAQKIDQMYSKVMGLIK